MSWLSIQHKRYISICPGAWDGNRAGHTAELATVRAEAEIGHLRQRHVGNVETLHPLVGVLVL
jgi:hypothetical protein